MFKSTPMAVLACGAMFWFMSGASAPAQEFSADLVRTDGGGAGPRLSGKLNVLNSRVRIETSEVRAGYFLVHGDTGAAYFLRPAARIFMDAKQSSLLTQVFVAVDPEDPCTQWQAAAKIAGAADQGAAWLCECVGADIIDGRPAIEYRAVSPQGRRHFIWISPPLRFPVRLQTDDGAIVDLANIKESPQPESLFAVPAGYRKFDPQHLIDRIKQSDVWVEPVR